MKDHALQIGVSLGALVIAVIHLWKPALQIDSITVVLLIISVLPWVQPLIKSIELLGVRVELQDLKNRVANASQQATSADQKATYAEQQASNAKQQATYALTATGEIGKLRGKRVLWVDDMPQNNEQGIKALEAQGIEVTTSVTTQEALEQVQKGKSDVIITDQLRIEDGIRKESAGYELMGRLQKEGIRVPVILSSAYPNREEAQRLGFYDTANTQQGVFELVMKAIQGA